MPTIPIPVPGDTNRTLAATKSTTASPMKRRVSPRPHRVSPRRFRATAPEIRARCEHRRALPPGGRGDEDYMLEGERASPFGRSVRPTTIPPSSTVIVRPRARAPMPDVLPRSSARSMPNGDRIQQRVALRGRALRRSSACSPFTRERGWRHLPPIQGQDEQYGRTICLDRPGR